MRKAQEGEGLLSALTLIVGGHAHCSAAAHTEGKGEKREKREGGEEGGELSLRERQHFF
jgi:hypothetical protein